MADELQYLIAPVAAVCAATIGQALGYRLRRSLPYSYLTGAAAGLLAMAAILVNLRVWDSVETLALSVVALGIFAGGFLCFLAVVALGISLRLRILSHLSRAGRSLTEAEIEEHFEGGMLLRRRVDRLISGGHVLEQGDRLVSGGTWLTGLARFNVAVKRFLTGRSSEFLQD